MLRVLLQVRAHRLKSKPLNFVTPEELAAGRQTVAKTTSVYTGVCWSKSKGKWQVQGRLNGRKVSLDDCSSEVEAAHVYDQWARQHGKRLNIPTDGKNEPFDVIL